MQTRRSESLRSPTGAGSFLRGLPAGGCICGVCDGARARGLQVAGEHLVCRGSDAGGGGGGDPCGVAGGNFGGEHGAGGGGGHDRGADFAGAARGGLQAGFCFGRGCHAAEAG